MPDDALMLETTRWLHYAYDDITSAELLSSGNAPPRHACLFAQQAAEKAIKAGLLWLGLPVIKTHDIVFLRQRLPKNWSIHLLSQTKR